MVSLLFATEEAKDRRVIVGMGRGIKVACHQRFPMAIGTKTKDYKIKWHVSVWTQIG